MNVKCLCSDCENYKDEGCSYDEVRIIKGCCEGYSQNKTDDVE